MMYITKNYHWNLHSELSVTGSPSLPTAAVGLIIEQNKKRPIYCLYIIRPFISFVLQNLLQVCERIPTIGTQLKILSTVKATMLGSQGMYS